MRRVRRVAVAFVSLLLAWQPPAGALADGGPRLGGSWETATVAVDPPGLPPLKGLMTFTADGEVVESRRLYFPFTPFGPVLETPGHGAWARAGGRRFLVTFQFLVQAAPNNPGFPNGEDLGRDRIRMKIELDPSGETFSGRFVSEARDADGNVVFVARGTVSGSRLRPEPLP